MLNQKSVLIVEGNCFVALDLALAVEEHDGRVIGPAASSAEALSLIERHEISAAVLDCQLADCDVLPVIALLSDRAVPLVIYTLSGVPDKLASALSDVPVLAKPLKPEAVLRVLAAQIKDGQIASRAVRNMD